MARCKRIRSLGVYNPILKARLVYSRPKNREIVLSIDSEKSKNKPDQQLIESNIRCLEEGAELIRLLESNQYTQGFKPAFQSTIGAHFRHILEHYRCFASQMAGGTFCYDKRERDQLLECDAQYALRTIDELLNYVRSLSSADSEFGREFQIEDEQTSTPVSTNLNRELLFLQSHTVHHYAIIGAMTRAFGNQPDKDFGVAIATRVHNEKCGDQPAPIAKEAVCAQ